MAIDQALLGGVFFPFLSHADMPSGIKKVVNLRAVCNIIFFSTHFLSTEMNYCARECGDTDFAVKKFEV